MDAVTEKNRTKELKTYESRDCLPSRINSTDFYLGELSVRNQCVFLLDSSISAS